MALAWSYAQGLLEAGLDEAGRGCLAGPVVAAAVILDPAKPISGLNDSKQLSADAREALRPEIEAKALAWQVREVSPAEIDRINILQASIKAMHLCVEGLQTTPELLLVDGHYFRPYPLIPHVCVVKGDAKLAAIAAASILAKTWRDERMQQLAQEFPHYGWERNMGYPTPAHKAALRQWGPSPHHRLSFRY